MKVLLLFGASGFIGRHVHARAAEAGFEVVPVARRHLDLASARPAAITRMVEELGAEAVVNCAGVTRGEPADLVAGNVVAVGALLTGLRAVTGGSVRLVHLGSAAEYGDVPPGEPVTESARPRPVAAYGVTKLAGTELVRAAGLDAVVLRVFNPIGPGAPSGTLAGRLAGELRGAAEEIRVGGLDGVRDFVDVRDVADAVVAAAAAPARLPAVLNVGSGRATAVRELVSTLVEVTGSGRPVIETAPPGSDRSAGVAWQQADITATTRVLDWTPARTLRTSLRDLWEETTCTTV